MPDCFISYASVDRELAEFVDKELKRHEITTFMASASLQPGQNWQQEILENLRNSEWVILLASRAACASAFVNQEIGGALHSSKTLIPIVWDMELSELPGWVRGLQAIDMRGQTVGELQKKIASIAQQIGRNNNQGLFIFGVILLALLVFSHE